MLGSFFDDFWSDLDLRYDSLVYRVVGDILEVELPGVRRDEVELEVKKGLLILKWRGKERVFRISSRVDIEEVSAEMRDGLLLVKLLKRDEKSRVIKVG